MFLCSAAAHMFVSPGALTVAVAEGPRRGYTKNTKTA